MQVSTSSSFGSTVCSQSGLASTFYYVTSLPSQTTYYWRVNERAQSITSAWSPVWNFSAVYGKPPPPLLALPVNGAIDVPTATTVAWRSNTWANTHTVEYSTSPSFLSGGDTATADTA